MSLTTLTNATINKIAAGEVIDRPLSIVKELVENAIDANAKSIKIEIVRGGRNFIIVTDDGQGIKKNDILLALKRHTTSKLEENDIDNIKFLGFRGEALPSITNVSKLKISSKAIGSDDAWEVSVINNKATHLSLVSQNNGTIVQVSDLFFLSPNRVRFLKSETKETSDIILLINKLAMSKERISFKLLSNSKTIIDTDAQSLGKRIEDILGYEFICNSIQFSVEKENIKLSGYTSVPTFNTYTTLNQYFFINRRFVKDRMLSSAINSVYKNLIPQRRFPQIVLYLDILPRLIDVNVHPTKSKIKFRDEEKIKNLVIEMMKKVIYDAGLHSDVSLSNQAIKFLRLQDPMQIKDSTSINIYSKIRGTVVSSRQKKRDSLMHNHKLLLANSLNAMTLDHNLCYERLMNQKKIKNQLTDNKYEYPLGAAKCQINNNYIIAEKSDYIILVDQHAAHKRLILENIKNQLKKGKLPSQILLIPEVVNLGKLLTDVIIKKRSTLDSVGLAIEYKDLSHIIVRQIPIMFKKFNITNFIKAIAQNIHLSGNINFIKETISKVLANAACHSSARAEKALDIEEMNDLLRKVERTTYSSQFNYVQPTFITLELKAIKKIFEGSY